MATSKTQLKAWFENGDIPTESQFAALIDAFRHVDTIIQQAEVNGLITALSGKLGTNKLVTDTASNTTTEVFTTSAVQAIVGNLQTAINNLNALLTSDDSTLDELQEVVDFIKQNKEDLDNLTIANIAGLQAALDAKLTGTAASTADILAGTVGTIVPADKLHEIRQTLAFWTSPIFASATGEENIAKVNELGQLLKGHKLVNRLLNVNDNDIINSINSVAINTTEIDYATVVASYMCEDNKYTVNINPPNDKEFLNGQYCVVPKDNVNGFKGSTFMCLNGTNSATRLEQQHLSQEFELNITDTNDTSGIRPQLIGNSIYSVYLAGNKINVTENSGDTLDSTTIYFNRETGTIKRNITTGDATYLIIQNQ